eukprot:scaffold367_cov254-Pinguiococcus_pyrenoidosus.AAC.4
MFPQWSTRLVVTGGDTAGLRPETHLQGIRGGQIDLVQQDPFAMPKRVYKSSLCEGERKATRGPGLDGMPLLLKAPRVLFHSLPLHKSVNVALRIFDAYPFDRSARAANVLRSRGQSVSPLFVLRRRRRVLGSLLGSGCLDPALKLVDSHSASLQDTTGESFPRLGSEGLVQSCQEAVVLLLAEQLREEPQQTAVERSRERTKVQGPIAAKEVRGVRLQRQIQHPQLCPAEACKLLDDARFATTSRPNQKNRLGVSDARSDALQEAQGLASGREAPAISPRLVSVVERFGLFLRRSALVAGQAHFSNRQQRARGVVDEMNCRSCFDERRRDALGIYVPHSGKHPRKGIDIRRCLKASSEHVYRFLAHPQAHPLRQKILPP